MGIGHGGEGGYHKGGKREARKDFKDVHEAESRTFLCPVQRFI